MSPLALLVGCLGLIAGGLWLTGEQIYQLVTSKGLDGMQLAGGLVLCVGGVLAAAFILRRLDTQVSTIEED